MIKLLGLELRQRILRTRLPFKYGIATMTEVPHVFVRAEVSWHGVTATGLSADHLPPKWFTKDPTRPVTEEIAEMWTVIQHAARAALELGTAENPFAFWQTLAARQARPGWPGLLAQFGTSLVERALLDGCAGASRQPLHRLVRENALGIDLGSLSPELAGTSASDWLPSDPLAQVTLRHTVGLGDAITDDEIAPDERVSDSLPQSLEAVLAQSAPRQFKLKVCGREDIDLPRLRRIAGLLTARGGDFQFSLDGNEQYSSAESLHELGRAIQGEQALRTFFERLLFIEQPFPRSHALDPGLRVAEAWPVPVPVIIDESDGSLDSLPRALALGYAGVSHKNCKGVFKGIRNACLLAQRRAKKGTQSLMTGEDLSNIGPVALPQDLAAQALLGNRSVERNGHYYFPGLAGFPPAVASLAAATLPSLYSPHPQLGAVLRIAGGQLDLREVNAAPFGHFITAENDPLLGEVVTL